MENIITNHVEIPKLGITAHFVHRQLMKKGHPSKRFKLTPSFPVAKPTDWTKSNSIDFPILGNADYGDCLYCAPLHFDQTMTANVGVESSFDESVVISDYLKLAGGQDTGLDQDMIIPAWKQGLASNSKVSILDALDVDPIDTAMIQSAIYLFGGVIFMLSVPDPWINNFETGYVWDIPAYPNPKNGHAVLWNGIDSNGRRKVQTWGTYGYITQRAVSICDPTAFTVFSMRWFNAQGIAPNGMHYIQLSKLWTMAGGIELPPSPFPAPVGPTPIPTPTPTPTTFDVGINIKNRTIFAPGYTLNGSVFDANKIVVQTNNKMILTPRGWTPI